VFAHLNMRTGAVTQAFWEIRSGVPSGDGGLVVASGVDTVTTIRIDGRQELCLIQVHGLWATLPPGRYWLSVAPVTQDSQSYLCKTHWFDDGLYVTAAPERYRSLLGGKIVGIGKSGVDDAVAKLTPLTPHDNDSWLKHVIAADRLTNADFLYGTLKPLPRTDRRHLRRRTHRGQAAISPEARRLRSAVFRDSGELFERRAKSG
jgi:hypothetical protein